MTRFRIVAAFVLVLILLAYGHEAAYRADFADPVTGDVVVHTWFAPRQDRSVYFESATILPGVESEQHIRVYERATKGVEAMAGPWRNLSAAQWLFWAAVGAGALLGLCAFAVRSRALGVLATLIAAGGVVAYGWAVHEVARLEQGWLLGGGQPRVDIAVPSYALGGLLLGALIALAVWPRRTGEPAA